MSDHQEYMTTPGNVSFIGVASRVTGTEKNIEHLSKDIDELKSRMDKLDSRLNTVEQTHHFQSGVLFASKYIFSAAFTLVGAGITFFVQWLMKKV